ncbi:MAG: hypothetical protein WA941_05845 [Nitrososphaeraceae archaeon]
MQRIHDFNISNMLVISSIVTISMVMSITAISNMASVSVIQDANAQGAQNLIQGLITRATGNDTFGDEEIGSYAIIHDNNKIQVSIEVDIQPTVTDNVLEAWLVDVRTGYYHSLGMLDPDGKLSLIQSMVNPYVYDQIVVTEEPADNLEPNPADTVGGAELPSPFGTMR